jgi:hypothetical protein
VQEVCKLLSIFINIVARSYCNGQKQRVEEARPQFAQNQEVYDQPKLERNDRRRRSQPNRRLNIRFNAQTKENTVLHSFKERIV